MPNVSGLGLPALDQLSTAYSVEDAELYYSLPAYAVRREVQLRTQNKNKFVSLLFGKGKWESTLDTQTSVIATPPANFRSEIFPAGIMEDAKIDIIDAAEHTQTYQLHHQKVESPVFTFQNNIRLWTKTRFTKQLDYIVEQHRINAESFTLTRAFHQAPYVFVADSTRAFFDQAAPTGNGDASGLTAKSFDYLEDLFMTRGGKGILSFKFLRSMAAHLADLCLPPYETDGDFKPNEALRGRYGILIDNVDFLGLDEDEERIARLAGVTDTLGTVFKGPYKNFAFYPTSGLKRYAINASTRAVTIPAPQIVQRVGPQAGMPETNPDYTNAQIGVGYIFAQRGGYNYVDSFPSFENTDLFQKQMTVEGASKLVWAGKPQVTTDFLIPYSTDGGTTISYKANTYKEKMKWISRWVGAMEILDPRRVIPFFYQRRVL